MREYYLKYNDYSICVYEKGKGNIPIVLLHGAGLNSAILSWGEVMNLLSNKYTVYAIDLLGYGKSCKPKNISGSKFYKTHIKVLENIIEQLKLDTFILSGSSMGGAISIGYALRNPDKVNILIPVGSWGLSTKMYFHRLFYWYSNTSITKKSSQYFIKYKWLINFIISKSLIYDKSKVSKELVDDLYEISLKPCTGESMQDFQRSSITKCNNIPDFTKVLSRISSPVLFINGDKDYVVTIKNVIRASKLVSHSHIYIMKGCRHWAPKERPEEYVKIIDQVISEHIKL